MQQCGTHAEFFKFVAAPKLGRVPRPYSSPPSSSQTAPHHLCPCLSHLIPRLPIRVGHSLEERVRPQRRLQVHTQRLHLECEAVSDTHSWQRHRLSVQHKVARQCLCACTLLGARGWHQKRHSNYTASACCGLNWASTLFHKQALRHTGTVHEMRACSAQLIVEMGPL